jgi:hypothetical protein
MVCGYYSVDTVALLKRHNCDVRMLSASSEVHQWISRGGFCFGTLPQHRFVGNRPQVVPWPSEDVEFVEDDP